MISDTLRQKRKEKKLTQKQLAELIGVSEKIIGNWESGITRIPSEYIVPLSRVFRCSPTAFVNMDKKTFEWYANNYNLVEGLKDFGLANPDLMNMVLWMVNAWDGDFEMLTLMAYYYCNLTESERSHISYLIGTMFQNKYERLPKTPMQDIAYRQIDTYIAEWHKLDDKGHKG